MSHVLRVGVADQIAYFRAFEDDGTAKADLTSATAGLSLSVFRVGLAAVSISSLSNKAADNTTHADGAIRQVAGNLYTVDLPDAATADQTPSVGVKGTYTGGVIEPVPHPIVNYDPAVAAVGANTVAPDNTAIQAIDSRLPANPAAVSDLADIKGATFDTATDSLEAIREAVDAGGDATEAKQDQILSALQGVEVLQVPSPNILGNLVLTQGDTYDGIANPRAQWNVNTDYTDGWSVVFTIRDKDDVVVYTNTGTVVDATLVAVSIVTPTGLPMVGCPGYWEGKYDVELSKGTAPNRSVKTIALGKVFVNEDQTR